MMGLLFWATSILVIVFFTVFALRLLLKLTSTRNRTKLIQQLGPTAAHIENPLFLGFFHPYWYSFLHLKRNKLFFKSFTRSNAGGGGERVLWTCIRDVQKEFSNVICVVYTGDLDATKEQILAKIKVKYQTAKRDPNILTQFDL